MDARGKFGEHERSVRVARGAAEGKSSFLSARVPLAAAISSFMTSSTHPTHEMWGETVSAVYTSQTSTRGLRHLLQINGGVTCQSICDHFPLIVLTTSALNT